MGKSSRREKPSKQKSLKKHRKKEKKQKRRHRSSSPSDSSSDSDVQPRISVSKQLSMGRAASKAVREILAHNHALRKELRELVRQLDNGDALDVSGIPDQFLRSRLLTLFDNLVQLRKNSAGQYFKRKGGEASVLSFVAPLLEETEQQLEPYRLASQQHAAAAAAAASEAEAAAAASTAAAEAAAAAERQQAQQEQQQEQQDGGKEAVAAGRVIGPACPPPGLNHHHQQQQQEQQEGLVGSDSDGEEEANGGRVIGPIGPAMPPPGVLPAVVAAAASGDDDGEGGEEEEEEAGRRVAGPAMPPAEWLAAAAQMEYPLSEEEQQEGLEGGVNLEEEEEGDDFMIGPPPPEIAEELDLASMDDRTAEVVRVLRVLQQHAADHAKSTSAQAAEQPPDAYEVLGVEPEQPAGEVKRRYWRLSLLIHPDKCNHPRAHDAFQAVTGAAKELQDAGLREKVDARRQEAALRREFQAAAAVAERERQWRVARGEATAEDLAGPVAVGGPTRDTWMTELPPERQQGAAAAAMPTGPFSGFSIKGIKSRGDTSGWTMTPQQRQAQLENGSAGGGGVGGGGGPLLIAGSGASGADAGVAASNPAQAARMAAAVDRFNNASRRKSLMEIHAERMAAGGDGKKRKKQKTEGGSGKGSSKDGKSSSKSGSKDSKGAKGVAELGYDPTQHPWRPFDREKDLGPGLDAKANAADMLKGQRALVSKFGGGQSGGRTFL